MNANFVCQDTQESYPLHEARWQADAGGLLDIQFTPPDLEWNVIQQRMPTMWRYREAIPLPLDAEVVTYHEGFTPLQIASFLSPNVWLKLEYFFPSGSYKDRGASVLISQAKHLGISEVVQDSSGNAGASIAQYCAKAGIACHIFVPHDTSLSKLTQIQVLGAKLTKVIGTREDTAQAAYQAAQQSYYASHVWNPFFLHGTKTFAYEVFEQMHHFDKKIHTLVLPVGNGTLLLGAYIGFKELLQAGYIQKMPRLIGVQAANNAPLWYMQEYKTTDFPQEIPEVTIAEGIAVARPKRAKQILQAIQETEGEIVRAKEAEILTTWQLLAKKGYWVEPTSAAVIAGLQKYLQKPQASKQNIVSVLTGSGLKVTDKASYLLQSGTTLPVIT